MSASGTFRQAGRAGRARPQARQALHARRHRLALGKGGGGGSRIPSAFTPAPTRRISAATNIARSMLRSAQEIVSETRPTRIQQRPVEMDASDSSEGSGKPSDGQGKRPISSVAQIHPCCASNPRVGGSNPSGRADVNADQSHDDRQHVHLTDPAIWISAKSRATALDGRGSAR
jgi:hypothetical protein